MRTRFRDDLLVLKKLHCNLQLIVSDIGFGVFESFQKQYPDDYLNLGIAESNIIGVASGMASYGFIPIVYTIVPFLIMRPFEQIRIDLALQKRKVLLVGVGGGLAYGNLGPTHHSFEDLALAISLPNMKVFTPAEPDDIKEILSETIEHEGPSYLRLGKNGESALPQRHQIQNMHKAHVYGNIDSNRLIITYGPLSVDYVQAVTQENLDFCVLKLIRVKPIDEDVIRFIGRFNNIYVVEEHTSSIGVGGLVAKIILENGYKVEHFKNFGIKDQFTECVGSRDYLLRHHKLLPEYVLREIG